jgi:anaerobic selenocysteine-containing dehydrogenase
MVSINWKIPLTHMKVGGIDQLPYLNEVGENFDPTYGTICLNVETAKQLEFEEGDTVTVESANGRITGKLHLTELLFPRVVGVAGALGRFVDTLGPKAHKYPYYNLLTSCKVMESDPISLGVVNARPVRIYKA